MAQITKFVQIRDYISQILEISDYKECFKEIKATCNAKTTNDKGYSLPIVINQASPGQKKAAFGFANDVWQAVLDLYLSRGDFKAAIREVMAQYCTGVEVPNE